MIPTTDARVNRISSQLKTVGEGGPYSLTKGVINMTFSRKTLWIGGALLALVVLVVLLAAFGGGGGGGTAGY